MQPNSFNNKRYNFVRTAVLIMVLITVGIGVLVGVEVERVLNVSTDNFAIVLMDTKAAPNLEFVKASIPDRWSIKEYKDGERNSTMSYYDDRADNYKGLGALEIINPRNEVVFSMNMIYGIGGSPTCDEIYMFADTELQYINSINDYNNTIYNTPINASIIDLSKSSFKEYNLFGLRIRYIGTDLYINSDSAVSPAFNPACDELKNVHKFNDPSIFFVEDQINDGLAASTYIIENKAHIYDMDGLNQILSTIEAK